jgi:hypothetical protein
VDLHAQEPISSMVITRSTPGRETMCEHFYYSSKDGSINLIHLPAFFLESHLVPTFISLANDDIIYSHHISGLYINLSHIIWQEM